MTININNINNQNQVHQKLDQQVNNRQQANNNTLHQTKTAPSASDSVSLTSQAKQLGELQKKNSKEPVLNQKKISELKTAISSGNYKINPEKLAQNIINIELDLLS